MLDLFDYILGTSAGSHVGALVASNKNWQDIYTEYIENRQEEQRPEIDSLAVFGRYATIAKEAKTPEQWVDLQTDYAKETDTCHYTVHLANVEKKYGKLNWGKSLHITTVDVETNERIVWDNQSGVTLSQAICASSSLPGLWPPIEINNRLYCDGGLYSMENADIVDAKKVLIMAPSLPVEVPISLEKQKELLEAKNSQVKIIRPTEEIMTYRYRSMDQTIIQPIFDLAYEQGRASLAEIQNYLEAFV